MRATSHPRRMKPATITHATDLFAVPCVEVIDLMDDEIETLTIGEANATRSGLHPPLFFPDVSRIETPHVRMVLIPAAGIVGSDRGDCAWRLRDAVKIDADWRPYGGAAVSDRADTAVRLLTEEVQVQFRNPSDPAEATIAPLRCLKCMASTPCGTWVDVEVRAWLVKVDWVRGVATYQCEID